MSAILTGIAEDKILLTETVTYKLWENAGKKIVEAQLTSDQISQIFQTVQQDMTAAGGNRTMVGKGMDAASAVNKAWEDLKTKVQSSGPIKNVDAMYDQAAEKLKQATGGDQGVMKYVQMYRDFAKKHPVAQGLIYSALIAAAGISGAGLGGAAALGLFKMVDKLLQGEKFSSAAYSGAKTGALAYGASKIGDLIKGTMGGSTLPSDYVYKPTSSDMGFLASDPNYKVAFKKAFNEYLQNYGGGKPMEELSGQTILAAKNFAMRTAVKAAKDAYESSNKNTLNILTESQVKLIFNHIENEYNLNEGLWDTIKGAAGKAVSGVVDYAKTKGQNLTTKVTADKLMQAWKKAGSPTDSAQISALLVQNGVAQDVITSVFNKLKIPTTATPTQQPAVKPTAPASAIGQGVSQATTSIPGTSTSYNYKNLTGTSANKFVENEERQESLKMAYQQAKNATKKIRFDNTVNEILTEIELLVEKYNIDKDSFQVAETEVKNAQRQLEAAIIGLDQLFYDAMTQTESLQEEEFDDKKELVKITLDDLTDKLLEKYPNIIRNFGHEVVSNIVLKVYNSYKQEGIDKMIGKIVTALKSKNEGQIYSTGGGAGQSYRKYKVKPSGVSEGEEPVNMNDPRSDGWRVYKVKAAGTKC